MRRERTQGWHQFPFSAVDSQCEVKLRVSLVTSLIKEKHCLTATGHSLLPPMTDATASGLRPRRHRGDVAMIKVRWMRTQGVERGGRERVHCGGKVAGVSAGWQTRLML